MTEHTPQRLERFPVHLGLGGIARALPAYDGTGQWYEAYAAGTEADGPDGRLVSLHTFDGPWSTWEVHPLGHELVVCVTGRIDLLQDTDGLVRRIPLEAGEYAINPPGVWHTADVDPAAPATCIFITSGAGTRNRDR